MRGRYLRELHGQGVQRGIVAQLGAALHRQVTVREGLAQRRHLALDAVMRDALAKQPGHQHRQFGKRVIGLEGAARVEGVVQVATPAEALVQVARCVLAAGEPTG